MTTRKIKDAKDLSINELIYFKGHAQATYLSDGRTVEEAIPTKFSDLENDQSLVNQFQLATINGQSLVNDGQDIVIGGSSDVTVPTKISDLINDSGFITINDIPEVTVPTKTSDLTNDSGFITINDVPEVEVPTKTSDLENNSGFVTSADNIASATKLQTTRYINGVGFDGTRDICNYAVCGTSASNATKVVTVNSDFYLQPGSKVTVKFNFPNTNSSPKLNVNSTGGRTMLYKGDVITNDNFTFNGEALYTFTYNGTYWVLEGDWDSINKQDTLVSGTNIKTINGASILGSGNITIEGGGNTVDTSSFATKETVMTDEIAVNADGFRTTNGEWFALPGTDSENNSDYCIATFDDIPTSTSDLTNDSGFITSADNIDSATKLQTTRYINGVGFDGTSNITNYVTCATAATAREKVVNPENFSLVTGAKITVKFTYANSVSSPGLNVAGTGTKAIQYRGSYLQSSQYWAAGDVVDFVYDGSVWQVIGPINNNVGSSSSSDTKVTQTVTSTNSTYPLLFSATANKTTTSNDTARFSTGLKYNPSTQSLLFPAATSGKSVNIGLGTKPSSSINGLVLYNAGGSQSDADFINICAADVFIRKADGSMGGRIIAELQGNASTATTLETPRTINGVSFDGSSDIEIDTTHIGKEHNAVIYFKGPAKSGSFYEHEYHTIDGTLVNPKSLAGGMVYILYNENVVSQAIPLNHVLTGNFFPIKVSTILTSASGNINNWTDAYIKCGISSGSGPIIYSIHLSDTNRTDVSNINLNNCTLEGHVYGTF